MTAGTARLSVRDRRVVLALAGAAVVWRWLVGLRTPQPGVDACTDLWLAAQFANGDFTGLAGAWSQPLWALLLAPAVACGANPFAAAQVAACACGALVVVVAALAAERLRESAGVPAAVLALVAAAPSVAAGAGSSTALHGLVVALAALAGAAGRPLPALFCATLAGFAGADQLTAAAGAVRTLRCAGGVLLPFAAVALLPPRPARAWSLWFAVAAVAIAGGLGPGIAALAPTWSPLLAVLGGVGLVRLSARWREVALCVAVAVECHGAWSEIEPRAAIAERILGRFAARRLHEGEHVASDLPRVLWGAGQDPRAAATFPLDASPARDPAAGIVVVGRATAGRATLAASLAGDFAHFELPADLADLATAHGLLVLVRRRGS